MLHADGNYTAEAHIRSELKEKYSSRSVELNVISLAIY